jgi:hypothetical protein
MQQKEKKKGRNRQKSGKTNYDLAGSKKKRKGEIAGRKRPEVVLEHVSTGLER